MGDSSVFQINNREIVVPQNSVMVIPSGSLHCCISQGEKAYHCAFQTDYVLKDFGVFSFESAFIKMLFDAFANIDSCSDYSVVSSWISLMLSLIDPKNKVNAQSVDDTAFLIERFFSEKYAEDVTIDDLALILNLSPRQTERLVILYNGLPFRKELCKVRMNMARELMKNPELSLSEIATKVGYRSYAGFWKAYKKYNEDIK